METSLHRQLKQLVARDDSSVEVRVGSFRIDAIDSQGRLCEVQHASLGALRAKVLKLRTEHELRIIKPLIAGKRIIRLDTKTLQPLSNRKSPKKLQRFQLFADLLRFTACFPHPNVTLEFWEVHTIEQRIEKAKHRWRRKNYQINDQFVDRVESKIVLHTAADLANLLNATELQNKTFCTKILADCLQVERFLAQQIAYVLHRCGATELVGKSGNSRLFEWSSASGQTTEMLAGNAISPSRKTVKTLKSDGVLLSPQREAA